MTSPRAGGAGGAWGVCRSATPKRCGTTPATPRTSRPCRRRPASRPGVYDCPRETPGGGDHPGRIRWAAARRGRGAVRPVSETRTRQWIAMRCYLFFIPPHRALTPSSGTSGGRRAGRRREGSAAGRVRPPRRSVPQGTMRSTPRAERIGGPALQRERERPVLADAGQAREDRPHGGERRRGVAQAPAPVGVEEHGPVRLFSLPTPVKVGSLAPCSREYWRAASTGFTGGLGFFGRFETPAGPAHPVNGGINGRRVVGSGPGLRCEGGPVQIQQPDVTGPVHVPTAPTAGWRRRGRLAAPAPCCMSVKAVTFSLPKNLT